jgi:hypothetical protein
VAVHPNMAGAYRDRIANLRIALAHVERVCSQTVRSAEVTSEMLTSSLAPLQEIAGRASERTHRPVAQASSMGGASRPNGAPPSSSFAAAAA